MCFMPGRWKECALLGWLILGAATIAMYRIAEVEGQSGIKWALITFLLCFLSAWFIPLPIGNVLIGFAVAFAIMTATKNIG